MRVTPGNDIIKESKDIKEDRDGEKLPSRWHVSRSSLAAMGGLQRTWKEMSTKEQIEHVFMILFKIFLLLLIVFLFICTLGLLSDAFQLIGGKGLGNTIKKSQFLQNPISATIIGMVISLVLQSSSTLISLLVGLVAGNLLTVHQAIPIMIGSEMGSSLMNVLVSMGQSGNRDQFRRAFACATMNDAFNLLNYITILPLEIAFSILENLSGLIVQPLSHVRTKEFKTLELLTEPILHKIVQIDDEALTRVSTIAASGNKTALAMIDRKTFIYRCIDMDTQEQLVFCPYEHIFAKSLMSDVTVGLILLIGAIIMLVVCLVGIVKVMQSLLGGQVAMMINKVVTYDFPRPFKFLGGYVCMVIAALIVVVMESSSVFRSALTPLVGIGVIPLERYYALVVGSNLGTTSTGVLAALASDPAQLQETLQIALCQTLYNLFGLLLFYPIPFMRRIPLNIAMKLGDTVAKYRWFSIVYTLTIFFLMPCFLLILSFLPSIIMLSIVGIIAAFIIVLVIINWFQVSFPQLLPTFLKSWDFLPDYLHSLKPYDKAMMKFLKSIPCCPRRFFAPPETEELHSETDSERTDNTQKESNLVFKQTPV